MEIVFSMKNGGQVALKSDEQNFYLAKPRIRTDRETGEQFPEWEGFSWHPTVEAALNKLMTIKVRSSEAATMKDLLQDIEGARREIRDTWDMSISL